MAGEGATHLAGKRPRLVVPLILFLTAKLISYTLLGAMLGWLGSVLSLTPIARGILQIAIALFMLGNALRMLNVHPIFRLFSFEPPHAVTRLIWHKSKNPENDAFFTPPILLGALTIIIPCGVTQAMMAVAIATSSPITGALTMFSFILGTSPVFFILVYLAMRLSSLLEKYFVRIVALALLVLGLISLNIGLNLVDSPMTFDSAAQAAGSTWNSVFNDLKSNAPPSHDSLKSDIRLEARNNGYYPRALYAPAGQPIKLHLITVNTTSCDRDFTIPSLNIEVLLDKTGEQVVDLPAQEASNKLHFSCSMGMYTGDIIYR
jgi:sulfite exporter TauE/SafE